MMRVVFATVLCLGWAAACMLAANQPPFTIEAQANASEPAAQVQTRTPELAPGADKPMAGTAAANIQVGVIVEVLGKEGLRVVQPGEILCNHEQLLLRVEVSREAFVYVVYGKRSKPANDIQVLFPAQGDFLLSPGGFQRVPPPGQWLMLDDKAGRESLFVLVNERPIAKDVLTASVSEALEQSPIPPPNPQRVCKKRPPPPPSCASKCATSDWQCRAECSAIASGERPAHYSLREEQAFAMGNLAQFKGIMLKNEKALGVQIGSIKLIHFPILHK